jgi:ABC-2 type transport system ATP-binding protein
MKSVAIAAQDLRKTYADGTQALRGVTFDVGFGEVFAYLGRNGSGKTTTVRLLTGLSAPTGGAAWVAGHSVAAGRIPREEVGVTMQAAALDPTMTGREHLAFVAGFWGLRSGDGRRCVDGALRRFGLEEAAGKRIASFSGGMKRRLDLAGALIHRPRILFLDEPTTGLDAQSRRSLWRQVQSLRDEGTAVFLTTQYLEEAEELADRVAILHRGRLAAIGSTDEVRGSLGSVQLTVRFPAGAGPSSIDMPDGRRLIPDARAIVRAPFRDADAAFQALAELRANSPAPESASVETPTLEDVFLELTGEAIAESPATLQPVA